MRLPRFRLRTLMIAVAVTGVAMATVAWATRSHHATADLMCVAFLWFLALLFCLG